MEKPETTETTRWGFDHKGVRCEIIFWTNEHMKGEEYSNLYKAKGVWNSYIYISKEKQPEMFNKFKLRAKSFKILPTSPKRTKFDYSTLPIEMSGGLTYYERLRNELGEIVCLKIGNDYNHIWNTGCESEHSIASDLKETIDQLINPL